MVNPEKEFPEINLPMKIGLAERLIQTFEDLRKLMQEREVQKASQPTKRSPPQSSPSSCNVNSCDIIPS